MHPGTIREAKDDMLQTQKVAQSDTIERESEKEMLRATDPKRSIKKR